MPKRLTIPSNHFALEEQDRCERKAAAAARKTSDGKPAGFYLSRFFIETAATIGRDPAWRPVARLYFENGWAHVESKALAQVHRASQKLRAAATEEAKRAARLEVDEAAKFKTLASVLKMRLEDAKRAHPKGAFAFRRAILGAAKEAERQQSTLGKLRDTIRREAFRRHTSRVLREINPQFGLQPPDEEKTPFDCQTIRSKYEVDHRSRAIFSDELIRKAIRGQANAPTPRPARLPQALEAGLNRGKQLYGKPPGPYAPQAFTPPSK